MEKKEILEGNKLIAKFMGGKYNKEVSFKLKEDEIWIPIHCKTNIMELKYHSSWDWLMPVLIKVVSMKEYYEFRKGYMWPYMEGNPMACFSITQKHDTNLTFEIIYKEVIKFIKWYNKEKSNDTK